LAIVTVLTPQTALSFEDAMVDFAETLDLAWRCNQQAIAAGKVELSRPTRAQLRAFILNPMATVVLVTNDAGTVVHGYVVAKNDAGGRHGGAQIRWIGARPDLTLAQKRDVFIALLDVVANIYGWAWGRVSNDTIYTLMLDNMVDVAQAEWDSQSLTYKRPTS
jgi:hypothetical protein